MLWRGLLVSAPAALRAVCSWASHSALGRLCPLLCKTWGGRGCTKPLLRCPPVPFSNFFLFFSSGRRRRGSSHLMINKREQGAQRDMALRGLWQRDRGWLGFGKKLQWQGGNELCATVPFAVGIHGARAGSGGPLSLGPRVLPLWHAPGDLGVSGRQGGRGRLNQGQDWVLGPRLLELQSRF